MAIDWPHPEPLALINGIEWKIDQKEEAMNAKYRIHRLDLSMTTGQGKPEPFRNCLEGEILRSLPMCP
jgi:hypothetical protein